MFGVIEKLFTALLASLLSASSHIKYVPLSNQKSTTQPIIIDLHPN